MLYAVEEPDFYSGHSKNNPLLFHDEIGRSRKPGFSLPPIGHTYGKSPRKDPEGAREVTSIWTYHDESKDKQQARDFLKLNKDCVQKGLINPKEIQKYRDNNQDVLKQMKKGKVRSQLFTASQNFCYGIRSRPSTPMRQIVQLQYMRDYQISQAEQMNEKNQENERRNRKFQVKLNNATKLRSASLEKLDINFLKSQEFKLEQFKNIEPKVQTRSKPKFATIQND